MLPIQPVRMHHQVLFHWVARGGIRRIGISLLPPLAAAILYIFPPGQYPIYPPCLIHQFTGLLCTGCGATHALAALLHGHLAEAFHHNPFFVLLLPLIAVYLAFAQRRGTWPRIPTTVQALLLAAAAGFTLLRNLS